MIKAEPVVVMVRGSVFDVKDCLARAQKLEDAASGSSSAPKLPRSDLDLRKHDRICGTVPKDATRPSDGPEGPRPSKRPVEGKVDRNDPVEASRHRVPEKDPFETSRQRVARNHPVETSPQREAPGKGARKQEMQELPQSRSCRDSKASRSRHGREPLADSLGAAAPEDDTDWPSLYNRLVQKRRLQLAQGSNQNRRADAEKTAEDQRKGLGGPSGGPAVRPFAPPRGGASSSNWGGETPRQQVGGPGQDSRQFRGLPSSSGLLRREEAGR